MKQKNKIYVYALYRRDTKSRRAFANDGRQYIEIKTVK